MKAIYKYDECGDLQHLRDLPSWSTDEECTQMVELYKWQNPEAQRVFWADFEATTEKAVTLQLGLDSGMLNEFEDEAYQEYLIDCEEAGEEAMDYEEWLWERY